MKISIEERNKDIALYPELIRKIDGGNWNYSKMILEREFKAYKLYFVLNLFFNRWVGLAAAIIMFGLYYLNEMFRANHTMRTSLLILFIAEALLIIYFKKIARRAESYRVNILMFKEERNDLRLNQTPEE